MLAITDTGDVVALIQLAGEQWRLCTLKCPDLVEHIRLALG